MTEEKFTFGIIGCGNIAQAIVNGLIQFSKVSPAQICASDIDKKKTENFRKRFNVKICNHRHLVESSRFILLAVKPKDIPSLCGDIAPYIKNSSTIISVAAGITIDSLHSFLRRDIPIIRMMPNLTIEYGKGLIGYCSKKVKTPVLKHVISIFSKTAFCFKVKEKDMFLVTAVAGSGPGFIFYLAEIIEEFLRNRGFSKNISTRIVSGLFEGSGTMLQKSGKSPADLKERVCSPGGTTIAGISKLIEGNISKILQSAFESAEKRAIELSGQNINNTRREHE